MKGFKKSPSLAPQNGLDLGLGDIIAGAADAAKGSPASVAPAPGGADPSGSRAQALSPAPVTALSKNEYLLLAERRDWQGLLTLTEERTAGGGVGELEPRFWWVRASVALGTLPLSILAAPLESVTGEILVERKSGRGATLSDELVETAALLLTEVSANLIGRGDYATALTFAERAYRLVPASQENLIAVVARILELPEPNVRRDPAAGRLRSRCLKLREELGENPAMRAPRDRGSPLPRGEEKPRSLAATAGAAAAGAAAPLEKRGLLSLGTLVVLVGVCLGIAAIAKWRTFGFDAPSGETAISLFVAESRPSLGAPAIERLTSLSQLDVIFYDFERGGGRAALSRPGEPAQPTAGRGPKEVVNTRGPLEPKEIHQALHAAQPEGGGADDVGTILFGAPKPRFPTPRAPAPAPRGETPQPLSVGRFDEPREFEVLVRTKVLTRPSFTGSPVAALETGDRVRAEGAIGDWLKIRSRNGQVGYILSQDVKSAP